MNPRISTLHTELTTHLSTLTSILNSRSASVSSPHPPPQIGHTLLHLSLTIIEHEARIAEHTLAAPTSILTPTSQTIPKTSH